MVWKDYLKNVLSASPNRMGTAKGREEYGRRNMSGQAGHATRNADRFASRKDGGDGKQRAATSLVAALCRFFLPVKLVLLWQWQFVARAVKVGHFRRVLL